MIPPSISRTLEADCLEVEMPGWTTFPKWLRITFGVTTFFFTMCLVGRFFDPEFDLPVGLLILVIGIFSLGIFHCWKGWRRGKLDADGLRGTWNFILWRESCHVPLDALKGILLDAEGRTP